MFRVRAGRSQDWRQEAEAGWGRAGTSCVLWCRAGGEWRLRRTAEPVCQGVSAPEPSARDGGHEVPLLGLGHLTAFQAARLAMPRFPLRESWSLEERGRLEVQGASVADCEENRGGVGGTSVLRPLRSIERCDLGVEVVCREKVHCEVVRRRPARLPDF